MSTYQRGDIYWVDLNPTQGHEINKIRPCIIIGADPINKARRTLVVIPLSTSASPHPPLAISVFSNDLIAVAVLDQIRAVDKSRFKQFVGKVNKKELIEIEDGLRQILVLPQ